MTLPPYHAVVPGSTVRLVEIDADYSGRYDRDQTKRKTRKIISRLSELQYLLFANADRSMLIVLQGPVASGKDGLIKKLF